MHNIEYRDYPLNVNKKYVRQELDMYVAEEDAMEGASGLPNAIRWVENGLSDSYEEAKNRIKSMDNGWYDQIAVKYKEHEAPKTKRYASLVERLKDARKSLYEKNSHIHYSANNVSSEYVGCKHCGSRIATKYIHSNRCPVCGADLRPASTLQAIENAKKKIADLEKMVAEEVKKGKAEVRWLVKIEYHT